MNGEMVIFVIDMLYMISSDSGVRVRGRSGERNKGEGKFNGGKTGETRETRKTRERRMRLLG